MIDLSIPVDVNWELAGALGLLLFIAVVGWFHQYTQTN